MPLTRLDNLLSSKTGKYVYVSPDDFNASDSLDNRGNSPTRPFLSIQRAFLEVARFSYAPGLDNDRFDEFTIMLSPGVHHIDNRPGVANVDDLPIFQYNQSLGEWETNSNVSFNLADPNNILYKFNGRDGGATIPRGTSLVGMDLRRTQLRPLYVPDPADKDVPRCALFNVTGGCYFWQFTIQDGDLSSNSPLYDATAGVGKVYTQPQDFVNKAVPEFSHHKITNFVFADRQDLGLLYRKIAHVFSDFQPNIDDLYVEGQSLPVTEYWSSSVNYTIGSKVIYNGDAYISTLASTNSRPNISPNNWTLLVIRNREFDFRVQENRIVGPLQDAVRIDEIRIDDSSPAGIATITVRTKINHEFFPGQYVAITNNGLNNTLNGVFKVYAINATDPKVFTYKIATTATGLGLVSGNTYTSITLPALDTNSTVQAEIDSVESASPYVFNVSIRSTWGICGIWADGRKATGFKSMVIAQYTGVSLQKDDRAFIRYDEFSNTWNQASLTDAFATTPYHIKGDAFWKDDWRNFHVKASDDSFIQCVSIFAVGFADHFLMESGGDMSITNSNSNFGNTSLHAIGYKGFAFNQDKGGYITDIIPPKSLSSLITINQQYYTLDVPLSRGNSLYPNATKLYISSDDARSAENRPASSVNRYRLGAKRNEKLFVKLDATGPKSAELIHSGFKKWTSSVSSIGPVGAGFTPEYNKNQDAAQLIDDNKLFIQEEAFGYILEKYPALRNIPYVNPNINEETARYRDAISLINLNRQEIIDRAAAEIAVQHPNFIYPGNTVSTNGNRFKDAYRLIQLNKTAIIDTAYAASGGSIPADTAGVKCKRDIGIFIDAVSLDVVQGGGNVYSRKFIQQYFNAAGTSWITGGLQGEETQSNLAFNSARAEMKKAINNQLTIKDLTITADPASGSNTSTASCADVQSAIDTLTAIITDRISAGNLTALPGETSAIISSGEDKCKRDIGIIVDAIAQDLFDGGNSNIIDATKTYFNSAGVPLGNGLSGEETQSITAFNKSRDWAKKAITNQLFFKDLTILADPVTGSNTSPNSCANVQITIDTLSNILTSAISAGNLNSLPQRNIGIWSQISDNSKCKRDIGYIVEAVVSDLKLGGNINTINAAESYYTANQLDYINNEKIETLDAYRYVRNLAISAMRNHNTYIINASTTSGSSIVTVPSTIGLVMGMKVRSVISVPTSSSSIVTYSNNIPSNAYIKKIGDGTNGLQSNQIQLGNLGSKFDVGTNINATATSSVVNLYVEFSTGVWESNLSPVVDNTITQDYGYSTPIDLATGSPGGECSSVASSIVNFYQIFATIINSGIGSIPRIESLINTSLLAQRATLFTLVEYDSSGIPTTNPHQLETGTAVKLVPKAKSGAIVDKKLIRLPKGFDSNTLYYVIAPGRKTDPYDYSTISSFNGSNQQTFLLATSEENANAGIYIYSSETNDINSNIQIDVYQYVIDINYDLHQYQTTLLPGSSNILEANRPHSFDITVSNVEPQLVFFRVGSDIVSSSLPVLSNTFGGVTISSKRFYYVRYITSKTFSIYETFANARDNINPVSFQPGSTAIFYTFANKRRSPLRYDPSIGSTNSDGCWYIETLSATNTIIPRIKLSDYASRRRTNDSFFTRIEDKRTKEDRIYRLRYVIPKNLKAVRDPLRGFVIKIRTDEKRRLLPQKIILKPTSTGSSVATFLASGSGEKLGLTLTEQLVLDPNFSSTYDPSPFGNPKRIETNSKISFTIQSARKILSGGNNYLQITAFDVGVDAEAFKTKLFTTVKISAPQGGTGSFVSSIPNSNTTNRITWSGNSSGGAYVHGYFSYQNEYYMILKDFGGNSVLEYKSNVDIIFTQGITSSTLLESPNSGRNLLANNQYVVDGANVYTLTVGDTINDDNGVSYTIASVEDVSNMEDTFYIFDINTIRKRIPGQQDGIYYLTCVKGNISPYPTGSGVGENFRKFKFSQPISKLYPESYKNDPEWYKGIDVTSNTLLDPPATISTADNYVHGLVTVNDSKNNLTKETILDFIADPGSGGYIYSGNSAIQAQSGSASAGSESRRIKISGNSLYPTEGKLYVELRRPSIARSGNHTFEYLGFGPGNYSTGFPARQEVVLTDIQDFYAQSKKQDGGIVFYTGLNSNGDLYIGNRKINAITGEETFLESARLIETLDEDDIGDSISDTFEVPVTFNSTITVNGEDNELESFFNCPVVINNPSNILSAETLPSLTIVTGEGNIVGYDPYLEYNIIQQKTGDVVIHQGRVAATVLDFNPRGLQEYQITTALSNVTPDLDNYYGSSTGGLSQLQNTNFGTRFPLTSGLIQLKGSQTLFTGSLGWIYASDYIRIENRSNTPFVPRIAGIQGSDTGSLVTLYWSIGITNTALDIGASSQIRITNAIGALAAINGVWPVYNTVASPFVGTAGSVKILVNTTLPTFVGSPLGYSVDQIAQPTIVIEKSKSAFKEVGVIGSEAIRTETDTIGDYKIGINTVARSPHSSYQTAFVSEETTPRANLDVVGTTFISGKTLTTSPTNNFKANSVLSQRTFNGQDNAFLVGGDSATPNNLATLRLSTTSGRVGINTTNAQLNGTADGGLYNSALSVIGNSVISGNITNLGNLTVGLDLAVNGGDITTTTTTGTFNFVNDTTFTGALNIGNSATAANLVVKATTLNFANAAETINIGITRTDDQFINIANLSDHVNVRIANNDTSSSIPTNTTNISKVNIGGAFNSNESQSYVAFDSKSTKVGGDLSLSYLRGLGSTVRITVPSASTVNAFNDAAVLNLASSASIVNFGGQGGTTKVRNALDVDASLSVNGNIILNGGLSSFTFTGNRAQLGTTRQSVTGTSSAPLDKPVDLVTIVRGISTNPIYYVNEIDTPGAGDWGGTEYQNAITGINNNEGPEPLSLPALTGKQYYLPLRDSVIYNEGDYLLIDTAISGAKHPEIVKIPSGGLKRTSIAPYYIVVERQPLGVFAPTRTDHPDNSIIKTPVVKVNISFDATWITNNIDSTGPDDVYNLAEFGGGLLPNDYIIVNRNTAGTIGELVKIVSSSTSQNRKLTINNGATVTVFEVDSITGNTIIGNPNTTQSNGNLSIYGGVTISGGTPSNSSECEKLRLTDNYDTTFQVNTCTGDTIIGNQVARIEIVPSVIHNSGVPSLLPSISSLLSIYQNSTDTLVYAYSDIQTTINAGGPLTTVSDPTMSVASNFNGEILYYLNVQSVAGFSLSDLILVGSETTGQFEIMKIHNSPTNTFPIAGATLIRIIVSRAQEGTSAITLTNGMTVKTIVKHPESAKLIDIAQRSRASTTISPTNPFLSIIIDLGYIVQQKIDYKQYVRLVRGNSSSIFIVPQSNGVFESGRLLGTRHFIGMDETRQNGAFPFRRGNLTVNNNLKVIGGDLEILDSTNRSSLFKIVNDDGHAEHQAQLSWNASTRARGDFFLYGVTCPESILVGGTVGFEPTLSVDNFGNVQALLTLRVIGQAAAAPSSGVSSLSIDNLGISGVNKFAIKQTGEIDSFGYTRFYTPSGARHTRFISTNSIDDDKILKVNIVYMVDVSSQDTMILTLPTVVATGDTVRVVEVGGALSYQTTLVIRAPGTGVKVQGDATGTLFGGRSTAYPSGELVVQTPNAAFTLIYLGSSDSNGQVGITARAQGWWLMEV